MNQESSSFSYVCHLEDLSGGVTRRDSVLLVDEDEGEWPPVRKQAPLLRWLAPILPFVSGCTIPVISGLNAELSEVLGDGLWAVATTYSVCALGALLVVFVSGGDPPHRRSVHNLFSFILAKPFHWIVLFGGVLGGLQNVHGAYAIQFIGPGVMTGTILIGQLLFSLLFDTTGIFWTRQVFFRWKTLLGVLVATSGCVVYQWRSFQEIFSSHGANPATVCLTVLSFCLGGIKCVQSGIGRTLNIQLGRFRRATALNYTMGCSFLLCVAAATNSDPTFDRLRPHNWKCFLAPPLNAINLISLCLGPLWMSLSTCMTCWVAGQLASSILMAHFGWLHSRRSKATWWNGAGLALVLVGLYIKSRPVKPKLSAHASGERRRTNKGEEEEEN